MTKGYKHIEDRHIDEQIENNNASSAAINNIDNTLTADSDTDLDDISLPAGLETTKYSKVINSRRSRFTDLKFKSYYSDDDDDDIFDRFYNSCEFF